MDRLNRTAVLTRLTAKLRQHGSWCGETHLQKSVYLLQDLLDVPTDFAFILYKHGPFSFALRDELTSLRADGLLVLEPQAPPYGPRISATPLSERFEAACAGLLRRYGPQLESVAGTVGARTVGELERLATALYVTRQRTGEHDGSVEARAHCIHRLKPHSSVPLALEGVNEIDLLARQIRNTASCDREKTSQST